MRYIKYKFRRLLYYQTDCHRQLWIDLLDGGKDFIPADLSREFIMEFTDASDKLLRSGDIITANNGTSQVLIKNGNYGRRSVVLIKGDIINNKYLTTKWPWRKITNNEKD